MMRNSQFVVLTASLLALTFLNSCNNPEESALKALRSANYKLTPSDYVRAASINDVEILKNFLVAGMDIDARGPEGDSALQVAAERGHIDALELLLASGANVDVRSKDGWTPLMTAAFYNRVDAVGVLLNNGADPSKKDNSGWTALMQAVYKGHTQIVTEMVKHGVKEMERSLLVAALMGHTEVARTLVNAGADINARTEENETPLMMAAQKGRLEAVEMLLAEGADAKLVNNVGDTAAAMAEERGHQELAALLQQAEQMQVDTAMTSDSEELPESAPAEGADDKESEVADEQDVATDEQLLADADETGSDAALFGVNPDATPLPANEDSTAAEEPALPEDPEARWFAEHNLDLSDPAMLERDPDGDGFTNAEEFVDDTDPHDGSSRPALITRAQMVDYSASEIPYVLEAVSGNAAQIARLDEGDVVTVIEGDTLGGFRVADITSRTISSKEAANADVSELTLESLENGSLTLLVRGQRASDSDAVASIQVPGQGAPISLRKNQEFQLPGEDNISYRVFEIRPTQVIVRSLGEGTTYTIKSAVE